MAEKDMENMDLQRAAPGTDERSEKGPGGGNSPGEAGQEDVERVRICLHEDTLPQPEEDGVYDLTSPRLYLNRELTWLHFNRRVLFEAEEHTTPLLERLKFVAITSSNTDEFFMKRIGGLKQLVESGINEPGVDGRPPRQQIDEAYDMIKQIEADKSAIFDQIHHELRKHGIFLHDYADLSQEDRQGLREYFVENIFPLCIPQGVGPAHPFPFISNLSLNLLVTVQHRSHGELSMARVKVPVGDDVPRFIQFGEGDENHFVKVEEVVQDNLDLLFPSVNVLSCELFRVTRNANTEKDEEKADDLLELIESEVRDRRVAPIVRVQVEKQMDPVHVRMLCNELKLKESDVFEIDGMVGKRDLWQLVNLPRPKLHYESHHPNEHPRLRNANNNFHALRREGDILLCHPFESFSNSVERFLREAAHEPKVRAIKMTLYRTSPESKVIDYLIKAAQNGKQVAVVIELKARFDETQNIHWANQLEEKGIHVTYGVVGFKTHAKMILVVRRDYNGFRVYSHVGTGNYHAGTARLYTDIGLLTADREVGHDLMEMFNFLTSGYTPTRKYNRILMAPSTMKSQLLSKIDREIRLHEEEGDGLIQMKINALEDPDITRALYRASQAGVRVELIVRDTCRLRPGIPGLSENIRVISIIGRFLEHDRVYVFRNGGDEEYYLGSADAMRRNLEHRVEVIVPVLDESLKRELRKLFQVRLNPRNAHWELRADGGYERVVRRNGRRCPSSQEVLVELASRRGKEGEKLKKLTSKGKTKREYWAGHRKV